jgi:hypothetical protein
MAKPAFTEHPEFMRVAQIASNALSDAAASLDCASELESAQFEAAANSVVDSMTRLLLRAWDLNHS